MADLITVAFTEMELTQLLQLGIGAFQTDRGNVRVGPLPDAALVTGVLKLQRASAGPEVSMVQHMNFPPWAVRALMTHLVPSGIVFPKPAPAKARTSKRRRRPTRRAPVPKFKTELEVDTALAELGDRLVHEHPPEANTR